MVRAWGFGVFCINKAFYGLAFFACGWFVFVINLIFVEPFAGRHLLGLVFLAFFLSLLRVLILPAAGFCLLLILFSLTPVRGGTYFLCCAKESKQRKAPFGLSLEKLSILFGRSGTRLSVLL